MGLGKKRYLTIFLALSTLFFAACGWHRWRSAPIEKKAEWIAEKISDKLDLTEEQEEKLNEIRDEIVEKWKENKTGKQEIHEGFIAQVRAEKMDKDKLRELLKKKHETHKQMEELFIEKIVEFHAILTPAQKEKAAELLEEFHKRMKG